MEHNSHVLHVISGFLYAVIPKQSWIVMAKTIWPRKPAIFAVWSFIEKVYWSLSSCSSICWEWWLKSLLVVVGIVYFSLWFYFCFMCFDAVFKAHTHLWLLCSEELTIHHSEVFLFISGDTFCYEVQFIWYNVAIPAFFSLVFVLYIFSINLLEAIYLFLKYG